MTTDPTTLPLLRSRWIADIGQGYNGSLLDWIETCANELQFPHECPGVTDAVELLNATRRSHGDGRGFGTLAFDCTRIVAHLAFLLGTEWPNGISGADLIDWLEGVLDAFGFLPPAVTQ